MNRFRLFGPILWASVLVLFVFSVASTPGNAEPLPPQPGTGFSLPAERNPAPSAEELAAQGPIPADTPAQAAAGPANCRFGAAAAFNTTQATWLDPLGAGWYLDFTSHTPSALTNAEYVEVIRIRQNKVDCDYVPGYTVNPSLTKTGLGARIAAHRGALWIVGNEPDRGPNPDECWLRGQDDTMPEVYAQIYHDVYSYIKANDPTARVANAGLVEVTPGRLQYLEKAWQAYQARYGTPMPVDVWNMHLYVLPETTPSGQPNGIASVALGTDPALGRRESGGSPANCSDPNVYCFAEHDDMSVFAEQIVAMRTWMQQHGQQNKPLILSEYSILYPFQDYDDPVNPTTCYLQDENLKCFTSNRVQKFMTDSFNYLDSQADPLLGYPADQNRLVQRWLWFGIYYQGAGSVSNLLADSQTALTPLGTLYQTSVASRPAYVNLRPDPVPSLSAYTPSGVTSAPIWISVYNIGTAPTANAFTVTFYSDSGLTQPIGSAVVASGLAGCEARRVIAKVFWPGLSAGSHQFWARVDSGGVIAESSEADNVVSGVVVVYPHRQYLPIAFRN